MYFLIPVYSYGSRLKDSSQSYVFGDSPIENKKLALNQKRHTTKKAVTLEILLLKSWQKFVTFY